MANKTRLRKVMATINKLAKNASDDAVWNQDNWWDGEEYEIGEDRELYALDYGKYNRDTGEYDTTVRRTEQGEPIKCKASGCFAGWTVALYAPPGTKVVDGYVREPGADDRKDIEDYATEVLGLTPSEGLNLFAPSNTLGDLKAMVKEYTA